MRVLDRQGPVPASAFAGLLGAGVFDVGGTLARGGAATPARALVALARGLYGGVGLAAGGPRGGLGARRLARAGSGAAGRPRRRGRAGRRARDLLARVAAGTGAARACAGRGAEGRRGRGGDRGPGGRGPDTRVIADLQVRHRRL